MEEPSDREEPLTEEQRDALFGKAVKIRLEPTGQPADDAQQRPVPISAAELVHMSFSDMTVLALIFTVWVTVSGLSIVWVGWGWGLGIAFLLGGVYFVWSVASVGKDDAG